MKRLTALFILTALVACSIFPAVAEEKDYEAVYAPVLSSIADLLSCENPVEHVSAPGETGIYEFRMEPRRRMPSGRLVTPCRI